MTQKKYLPYLVLLLAALLLFYVKQHQRGKHTVTTDVTIPIPINTDDFKKIKNFTYTKHATCRMVCRHIDEREIKEIVEQGNINYNKIETDSRGKTYPIEGITHDKQKVRIVVAPKKDELVIVTVIDLDSEWSCDCK